ncbi:aminoacyl-tRNA deacylase and HDOD domain-containing protein [Marinimicrobium alkaliphilum]|uniref:aminoacyl-tRNA deacylase and HDOD domain-containing protein n=1 Tax=Marinimicrobium alkaliphilum TaxID=2202654 RepID=UPI000DBA6562|nr:HDOD domain-containing protein [Marinimicrobium alkaliphilum]
MPIPNSIESLLNAQQISYQLAPAPKGLNNLPVGHEQYMRDCGAVTSMILGDEIGQIQVLISADSLLDLAAVNRRLERNLKAASPDQLKQFCTLHSVSRVPAIPKIGGFPTLVDKRLLDKQQLLLESGDDEQLITLSRKDFEQVLADAMICDIAQPLAPLEQDAPPQNDSEQILGAVRHFTERRVRQRLEETLELPPLTDTAQKIVTLRVNPNADVSDLAQIVETDPSLAAQVVSWASSPYYSAPGKIRSIHDAIVRVLGYDMVLNLALGLALGKTLSLPKQDPEGSPSYWEQSVYVAATVEGLVSAIPREQRPSFGMAYLAGLLHNFGYLVLSEVFPPYFEQYCRLAEANPHLSHQPIERHLIGITREQLASTLMSLWSMPEEVVQALRHQNNPAYDGEHHLYAKLIFVARRLLAQEGLLPGPKLDVPAPLLKSLGLEPDKARSAVLNVMESVDELGEIARQIGGS